MRKGDIVIVVLHESKSKTMPHKLYTHLLVAYAPHKYISMNFTLGLLRT